MTPTSVSVVVSTRQRGTLVMSAIESVLASTGVEVELIVVDQSSDDETARAVAAGQPDGRLRYVRSDETGVSRGRNLGLRMASNPVVLITDDDVVVSPTWASEFLQCFRRDERVAVAFCRVDAGPHDPREGFVPDHSVDKPVLAKSLLGKPRVRGIGAGMAVRRDIVLGLGGFDELLGPGAPLDSGEDRDLAVRALAKGWWVAQTPHAHVEHNGFRTWDEGRALARRDWFGIGAAYAKPLKCCRLEIVLALVYEVLYLGLVKPVALRLAGRRRHSGVRQFRYFFVGLVRGLRAPIDHRMMLYV